MSIADSDVETVCSIAGVSRDVATRTDNAVTQANNNNVERAINELFDDPETAAKKYNNAWDDTAFSAGRDGDDTQNPGNIPAFNIQGPDEVSNYQNSTNPTRPPSRAANRSPLGRLVDLTASEGAGIADSAYVPGAPTTAADEDADLRRALAESAAQSGVPAQEVGVMDNDPNVKYFGPANRPDYQQDQWALVPTKTDSNSATADPPPSARQRIQGAPAFLRSLNDHRLGAIISIYHSIPLARNVLLSYAAGSAVKDYGSHMDWWKGQPIMGPARDGEEADASPDGVFPSFVDELQRLLAFLDTTDRSYGSADVIAKTYDIDPTHGGWAPPDLDHNFFDALKKVGEGIPNCRYDQLETLGKGQPIFPKDKLGEKADGSFNEESDEKPDEDLSDDEDTARFISLDVGSNDINFQWQEVDTLYDALDRLFWHHALGPQPWDPEDSKTATLVEPSAVLTIRFNGEGLQRTCDIPAVLYVDRYVEERKNLAIELQVHMNQLRQTGLKGAEDWKKSILKCHHGANDQEAHAWLDKSHGSRDCWQKVIQTCEDLMQRLRQDAQWRQVRERVGLGNAPTMNDLFALQNTSVCSFTDDESQKYAALQEKVRLATEQLAYIETQLSEMETRHRQCLEALNNASKVLTCREEEADAEFESKYIHKSDPERYQPHCWNPTHKYHLRGVATAPGIAYLWAKEDGDLMQFEDQPDTKLLGQWWKVGYAANEPHPITVEKTTLGDVLVAAGSESKHPILVYATAEAYEEDPVPLSQALRMFVQADNRSFQQELGEEQSHESAPAPTVPTRDGNTWEGIDFASSTKRKHSRSSSLATLGSTGHGSDREMLLYNDTFDDDDGKGPTTSHQEFASPASQPNKLGGLVESLATCRTTENVPLKLSSDDHLVGAESRGPEMQERQGRPMSFLARPDKPATDVMNMDMEVDEELLNTPSNSGKPS
ncbi:ubiquitin interaction domain-containing protein [Apiospora marii]|uniref:Ubiquitin interaction domain-containing protein n=1 Tax=Apiospora marii TaxID=335849 RepID=A0ABR1RHT6_9PEZI